MVGNLTAKKPMPGAKRSAQPQPGEPAIQVSPVPAGSRCFLDTNILVYADSPDEPAKLDQTLALLKQLRDAGTGVISTQVLNEYCNVALNKLKLPHTNVRARLRFWQQQFEVCLVTPEIIAQAVDLHQTRSISYYDALIVASAQIAGCAVLYSEDMNMGESIAGTRIVNPFE
jgi:predicted nucleic acid-binding protein